MVRQYKPVFDINDPFLAVSFSDSLSFKTGKQRSERPLFVPKTAPCRQACPIGIDIPAAFEAASKGDIDGALNIYLQDNPLPGVCGRVCYHPCEKECNRGQFDEPLNVRSFERFLSDHGKGRRTLSGTSKKGRIAVVGSGPAGLSAAYHLARWGYSPILFEGRPELGGMLRYGVPSYRLPRAVLDREIERILSLGIETRLKTVVGKDLSWSDLQRFDAVFVAVGLQSGKRLFEKEGDDDFILTGPDLLAHPRRRPLKATDQEILIVGGGNVAIDAARTLLRLRRTRGTRLKLISPESRQRMPALQEEIEGALEEGILILNGWAPRGVQKKNGALSSVRLCRVRVRRDKGSGEVRIAFVRGETRKHHADQMIVAIGQTLRPDAFPEGMEIQAGRIHIDPFGRTSHPKFFAGGDAAGERTYVADAIAAGKMGALGITCFLEGKDVEQVFRAYQIGKGRGFSSGSMLAPQTGESVDLKQVVSFEEINTLFFSHHPRNNPAALDPTRRKNGFREVLAGLHPSRMEEEISRCFRCGTCIDCKHCVDFCPDLSIMKDGSLGGYCFDYDHCKGCGICFVACPRHVIEMAAETS